ncbi:Ribonucleases P/MRP protein subunit POP1 [Smittium mucronatum]|uniref:Ribonucleases P/MRP protein subunit POP1 n=1 Tax=Smittium mucronatum TaxID=133383 RepID=A0A1R0GWT2_9FUNG|nr:Ribonucleases P/MRP protein subunit POP1 [Smittium mucronatum]
MKQSQSEKSKSKSANSGSADSSSLTTKKKAKPPPNKNRRHRRKLSSLVELYTKRQVGKRWLETHMWHTKRMKMVQKWGIMIAETPNDKSYRAIYKALHKSIIHDVSYTGTIKIVGNQKETVSLLGKICTSEKPIDLLTYLNGSKAIPLILHQFGDVFDVIGPALGIWGPIHQVSSSENSDNSSENSFQELMIRVHPSIISQLSETLNSVITKYPRFSKVKFFDVSSKLMSIDVYGTISTDLLQCIIKSPNPDKNDFINPLNIQERIWDLARCISDPKSIPEGLILSVNSIDPRLGFPQKMNSKLEIINDPDADSLNSTKLDNKFSNLIDLIKKQLNIAPSDSIRSDLWSDTICKEILESKMSENDLNKRRQNNLIPGSKLEFTKQDSIIPVMLIRRGPSHYIGHNSRDTKHRDCVSGWTLICPSGFALDFWKSLTFAGGRAIGLSEQSMLCFESGLPNFPSSWPTTNSYYKHLLGDSSSTTDGVLVSNFDRWARKPKSKKENFEKRGALSPFYPPIHSLVGIPEPKELIKYSFMKAAPNSEFHHAKPVSKVATNVAIDNEKSGSMDIEHNDENFNTVDVNVSGDDQSPLSGLDPAQKSLVVKDDCVISDNQNRPWVITTSFHLELVKNILATHDIDGKPVSFENWVIPLAKELKSPISNEIMPLNPPETTKEINLNHAVVRVLLYSVCRGSAEDNAVLSIPKIETLSAAQNSEKTNHILGTNNTAKRSLDQSNGLLEELCNNFGKKDKNIKNDKFPSKKEILGYVINGNYSYSVSKGFAIGVISLKGLFKLWKQQVCVIDGSAANVSKDESLPVYIEKSIKKNLMVDVTNTNGKLRRLYSLSLL